MPFDASAALAYANGSAAPQQPQQQQQPATFNSQAAIDHHESTKPKGFDSAAALAYFAKGRTGRGAVDNDVTRATMPVTQPVRNAAFSMAQAALTPVKAVGDVVGSLQRGTVGGLYGAQHGGVTSAINEGAYGIFHPNDEKVIDRNDKNFRETIGLERFKDEKSTDFARKVGNWGVDTLGQAISDPMTLVGAPLIKGAIKGLEAGAKAIPFAEKIASSIGDSRALQGANDYFRSSGDLRRTMTPQGVGAANAISHAVHTKYGQLIDEHLKNIDAHADEINAHRKGDDLHKDVRNSLDTAAYYAGTGDVRAAAVAAGHEPSELAKGTPELNALTTYKPGYTPMQSISEDMPELGVGYRRQARQSTPGFNLEQLEGDNTAPLSERMKARIKQEFSAARDAEIRHKYTDEFGLDRGRYDTTALHDEMGMPETSPARKAELQKQIDEMEPQGKAAQDRYNKYIRAGTPEAKVQMGPDTAKGGSALSNKAAWTQALQDTGMDKLDFDTKWSPAQHGDYTLKPGSRPFREQFSSSQELQDRLKSDIEKEKDPGRLRDLNYQLGAENKRNAAIATVTERQNEILQRANTMVIPLVLKDRLFAKKDIVGVAPRWLKGVSDMAKSVMFLNPIPHIKNISVLMMQGKAGMRGYLRGNQIFGEIAAGSKNYDAAMARLDNGGMRSNFFKERDALIDKVPGLREWQGASHDKLWQYDTAMRLSMLEHIDAKYGKTITDFEKGGMINDTLFDYADRSPFSSMLEEFGAPFPHWRLTNPSRPHMGIRENPGAVNRIVNAEQNANKDVVQGKGYDIDFASPVDELGKAATNPGKYFGRTLSPLTNEIMPYLTGEKNVQDLAQDATSGSLGSRIMDANVPFAQLITEIRGGRYPSKADIATAVTAQLFGANPTNAQSARALKIAEGMKLPNTDRFTATMHAR